MISFLHIAKITVQKDIHQDIHALNNFAKKYQNVTTVVQNLLYFASQEASSRLQFQPSAERLFQALMEREEQQSTELGLSIAIPHGRLSEIQIPIVSFYVLENSVLFQQEHVQIMPCLWIPEQQPELHLTYLSELVTHLSDEGKYQRILSCSDDEQLRQVLVEFYQ
jgi:PTS system nitrogen regulatory IIA component